MGSQKKDLPSRLGADLVLDSQGRTVELSIHPSSVSKCGKEICSNRYHTNGLCLTIFSQNKNMPSFREKLFYAGDSKSDQSPMDSSVNGSDYSSIYDRHTSLVFISLVQNSIISSF
jgi:hypothetical protein